MKRTILLLMVGAAAIFTLSSCLQNEEPAGIENLRNAKSELIKAEAQYKTAEIALVQAQAALQETIKAGQELDNRLKEIDVELAEAELAYEKTKLELQEAEAAQASAVQLAWLQAELLKQELEQQRLANEKELMAENHKAALAEAQAATAEAENAYQTVLAQIEAATVELNANEKKQLKYYTNKVEEVRGSLNDAQDKLVDAQQALIDAKYDYDATGREIELTAKVTSAELALAEAKELLEAVQAIDLTGGASDWITRKEAVDGQIDEVQRQIDEIELAAEEKRQEAAPLEAEMIELQKQQSNISTDINAAREELDLLYRDAAEEETIEVPDYIWGNSWFEDAVEYFWYYASFYFDYSSSSSPYSYTWTAPKAVSSDWGDVRDAQYNMNGTDLDQIFFIGTILGLPEFVDEYYDDGQLGWNMRNKIRIYYSSWQPVNDYILSEYQLAQEQEKINYRKTFIDAAKAEYNEKISLYNTSKTSFLKLMDEYGIVYDADHGSYEHSDGDMMNSLTTAYNALYEANEEYNTNATPIPADVVSAFMTAFRNEQSVRESAFGQSAIWADGTLTYKDFTDEKWNNATIDFSKAQSAFFHASSNDIISGNYFNTGWFESAVTNPDLETIKTFSPAQQWYRTSMDLYGVEWMRNPIPEELKEQIQVIPVINTGSIDLTFTFEESTDVYKTIVSIYGDTYSIEDTDWYGIFHAEKYIEIPTDVIAEQDSFKALSESLTEIYDKYVALSGEKSVAAADINQSLLDLTVQSKEVAEMILAKDKEIKAITDEAAAMDDPLIDWSQVSVLTDSKGDLQKISGLLGDLIGGVEVTFPGQSETYTPGTDEIESAYEEYISEIENDIAEKEKELRQAQINLDRFKAGDDNGENDAAYAIEEAEIDLEQAQAEYDYWTEQYEFYSGLLKDLMASIISGAGLPDLPEEPENPDTPDDGQTPGDDDQGADDTPSGGDTGTTPEA